MEKLRTRIEICKRGNAINMHTRSMFVCFCRVKQRNSLFAITESNVPMRINKQLIAYTLRVNQYSRNAGSGLAAYKKGVRVLHIERRR